MTIGTQVEIHIRASQQGRYPVEIILTDAQGGRRHFSGHVAVYPWVPTASPGDDGQRLFHWLFADPSLKTAWDRASEHRPHHLRLRIDTSAPELHAIPWELMREPAGEGISRHLAATAGTPFSRYSAGDWPPQQPLAAPPIRILAAIADPEDLGQYNLAALDVETEQGIIADAFQDLATGQVRLSFLEPPVSLSRLEAELKQGCDLLHLVAHGKYSAELGKGVLYLADGDGQVALEADRDLAAMIDRLSQEQRPCFVFLASCQGATRDTTDAFRGLAPTLIEVGVPAVLAMQDVVAVNTVRAFTRAFYKGLFAHGQVDLACNEARSALLTGDFPGSSIPVLFSRLVDNQLLVSLPGAVVEAKAFEPETVYVPAGPFLMGSLLEENVPKREAPQHEVALPAYRIGKYPVTVCQYAAFIRDKQDQSAPPGWFNRKPPSEILDHPATKVSWYDAVAYCIWLSQQTGRRYTLPSEAEWEKAASWDPDDREKRTYPWGNEWIDERCSAGGSGTTVVDAHPDGASAYCVEDLVGNAQEWTRSLWGSQLAQPDFDYPYDPADGREVVARVKLPAQARLVHRGGSFKSAAADLRCTARGNSLADSKVAWRGFRVAMKIE